MDAPTWTERIDAATWAMVLVLAGVRTPGHAADIDALMRRFLRMRMMLDGYEDPPAVEDVDIEEECDLRGHVRAVVITARLAGPLPSDD